MRETDFQALIIFVIIINTQMKLTNMKDLNNLIKHDFEAKILGNPAPSSIPIALLHLV